MRAKDLWCALVLSGLAALASGCGDDTSMTPTNDMAAGVGDMVGGGQDLAGSDMGLAPTFEGYVIDLIDNHTSPSATPDDVSTNAAGLPDTQNANDFAKYFP